MIPFIAFSVVLTLACLMVYKEPFRLAMDTLEVGAAFIRGLCLLARESWRSWPYYHHQGKLAIAAELRSRNLTEEV